MSHRCVNVHKHTTASVSLCCVHSLFVAFSFVLIVRLNHEKEVFHDYALCEHAVRQLHAALSYSPHRAFFCSCFSPVFVLFLVDAVIVPSIVLCTARCTVCVLFFLFAFVVFFFYFYFFLC